MTGRKNIYFFHFILKQKAWTQSQSVQGSVHERRSTCWRSANTQYSGLRNEYCRWRHYRENCRKKCAETQQYCQRCYVSNINPVFQSSRGPIWDTFFSKTINLDRNLTTCGERVNISIRGTYINSEKLSLKNWTIGIKYTIQQTLFHKKLAKFNFESICVQEESLKDTKTTTWMGKHVPNSVSISSNPVEESLFLYNSDPHHLISYWNTGRSGIAK